MTGAPEHDRGGARRGSGRPLLACTIVFLALFFWQRSRSTFLQIEGERAAAAELAAEFRSRQQGIGVAEVLALRDYVSPTATREVWRDAVAEFCERLGTACLLLDFGGIGRVAPGGPVPERAVAMAIRDLTGDEVATRRFLILRERFAARGEQAE